MSNTKPAMYSASPQQTQTNTKTVGSYILGETLGRGSFAKVYKGASKSNPENIVAIKAISKATYAQHPRLQQSLASEISIMKEINHHNIVRMIEVMESEKNIYIVMEYCNGKDMSHFLAKHKPLSEIVARHFMKQLAAGLRVLYDRKVTHRDLKPQNLLLSESSHDAILKIADFGFARSLLPNSLADTVCGSPLYMAPEVLNGESYSASADLWSVGVILWEMLTGKVPYPALNHIELKNAIDKKTLKFDDLNVSSNCRDLLSKLLRVKPSERITFLEFFEHIFFRQDSPPSEDLEKSEYATPSSSVMMNSSSKYELNPPAPQPNLPQTSIANSKLYPSVRVPKTNPFKHPIPAISNSMLSPDAPAQQPQPSTPSQSQSGTDLLDKDYVFIQGYDGTKIADQFEEATPRITQQHTQGQHEQMKQPSRTIGNPVEIQLPMDDQYQSANYGKHVEKMTEIIQTLLNLASIRSSQGALEDALVLCIRTLEKIQTLTQTIKTTPQMRSSVTPEIFSKITEAYEMCMEKAQTLESSLLLEKTRASPPLASSQTHVHLDRWLYDSALQSCRDGAIAEWNGNFPMALRHYAWASHILTHLNDLARGDETDSNVLRHYLQSLTRRMQITRRKATPDSSTSSSPSSLS